MPNERCHRASLGAVAPTRTTTLRCQQGPLPGPGLVGAKVRAVITLAAAMRRDSGMVQATFGIRYEVQGAQRPPCVAETDYLYS